MAGRVLGSEWGRLNPALLASIFPCDRDGLPLPDQPSVVAPPIDGSIELSANWQSPFENMGPESKAPAIMAMLQTGMLAGAFLSLTAAASQVVGDGIISGALDRVDRAVSDLGQDLFGLTGVTKLNATQVFTGAAPVKIPLTLLFRAFRDPRAEVQEPVDALAQWQLPLELSLEGSITGAIRGLANGNGLLKSLFPSRAPRYVALRYAGYLFAPLVIESMSFPIVGPRASDGSALSTKVQISLASITALDGEDWRRARSGQGIRMAQIKKP